ncbi:MAG: helix-turn-helix domain-containing protein, partial [Rikenellaceae bacterium]
MKHLTVEQRYTIFAMLQTGYTQKEIAETIKVNKSTISRELRRNCDKRSGKYNNDLAHRKAQGRKKGKPHAQKLTYKMRKRIRKLLKKGF